MGLVLRGKAREEEGLFLDSTKKKTEREDQPPETSLAQTWTPCTNTKKTKLDAPRKQRAGALNILVEPPGPVDKRDQRVSHCDWQTIRFERQNPESPSFDGGEGEVKPNETTRGVVVIFVSLLVLGVGVVCLAPPVALPHMTEDRKRAVYT